jgi:hypothetical protein
MRTTPALSELDVRVLRATDPMYERTPQEVGKRAGCEPDVALSTLRRLRLRHLVEDDGHRGARWLRTRHGGVALEHAP